MTKEQIKAWRKTAKLTQVEAAKHLCISRAQYQQWEDGRTPVPPLVDKYIGSLPV